MAVFEYKALDTKGSMQSGIIDGESKAVALDRLRSRALYPVSLTPVASKNEQGHKQRQIPGSKFFKGVKFAEIAMVTRLIATLLSAGFPLVKAVGTVVEQTRSRPFQRILSAVKDAMEEGSSFAEALGRYPHVFSGVYINMVTAGESSGTLEVVLERLADFAEQREETRKKIQASLAYPLVMALVGSIVLVVLLVYIVPGIIQIFSDMNQVLPLPTRMLIWVSHLFTNFWWLIAAFPLVGILAVRAIRKTRRGRLMLDRLVLHIPIAGGLVKKGITARLSRTLGALLENGVPMLDALAISRSITGNIVFSDLVQNAMLRVEQGGDLGTTLSANAYFPPLAAQMIQVGEKSGEIEKMLVKTADLYDREVAASVAAAASLVEPIIILVMGVVVGMIIMAICLPIVEINQMII